MLIPVDMSKINKSWWWINPFTSYNHFRILNNISACVIQFSSILRNFVSKQHILQNKKKVCVCVCVKSKQSSQDACIHDKLLFGCVLIRNKLRQKVFTHQKLLLKKKIEFKILKLLTRISFLHLKICFKYAISSFSNHIY
jgi:hypothetical protein